MRYLSKKAKRKAEYLQRQAKRKAATDKEAVIKNSTTLEDMAKVLNVPLGPKCFEYKR